MIVRFFLKISVTRAPSGTVVSPPGLSCQNRIYTLDHCSISRIAAHIMGSTLDLFLLCGLADERVTTDSSFYFSTEKLSIGPRMSASPIGSRITTSLFLQLSIPIQFAVTN